MLGLWAIAPGASAQRVTTGSFNGKAVVYNVTVPASSTAPILTTPAAGDGIFILTQLCVDISANMQLRGSTLGELPRNILSTGAQGTGECTTYSPGIPFPPAEAVSCNNGAGIAGNCLVIGVVSKR
jgi:hypothetical protein